MEKAYLQLNCINCRKQKLQYSPDRSKLICDNCGHTEVLPKDNDTIAEQGLSDSFSPDILPRGLSDDFLRFVCKKCGTPTALRKGYTWESCAFCGNDKAEAVKGKIDSLRPSAILPFTFPRAKAIASFQLWARSGWFTPNALLQAARNVKIQGVYVPFWRFEVLVKASWKASISSGGGKAKGGKQAVSGYFEHFFDNINLLNSSQIDPLSYDSLGEYQLAEAVPFDPQYLEGVHTEIAGGDVKGSLRQAEKILDDEIRRHINKKARGNLQNLSVRAQKQLLDVKILLVPVWIATFQLDGETEWLLINGRNGEFEAEKPTSWVKMLLVIVGAIVGLLVLLFLSER